MSSSFRRRARWIVYSLLATLAVLALGLLIYVRSGHPDRWARGQLIEALGRALGRPVTVERVTLQYLPPGAVVEGLSTGAPVIAAERVEVQVSARALLRGKVVLKDVEVQRPVLRWDLDGEAPLLEPPQQEAGGEPRLTLRRLRLVDGTVLIGSQRRALEADVEGLSLLMTNLTGQPGGSIPWSGGIAFKRGRFSFGDLQLAGAAGSITFQTDAGGHVSLPSVRVRADGVEVTGRGEFVPGEPRRGRFQLAGSLDPSSPALARPLPQFGARHLDLRLDLTLEGDSVHLAGTFIAEEPTIDTDRLADGNGPAPAWNGRRADGRIEAGEGRLKLMGNIEGFSGGRLEGSYEGSADVPRRHTVSVSADRVDLGDVLSHVVLPGDPLVTLSSALSGDARMQWEGDIDGAAGTARLVFEERPGVMPLSGEADFTWKGRRVTLASSALRLPGADLDLSGLLDMSRSPAGLDLVVDVRADDVTPLALFLEDRFAALFRDAQGGRRLPMIPTDIEGSFDARMKVTGDTGRPHVEAGISSGGLRLSLPSQMARVGAAAHHETARVPLALDTLQGTVAWDPESIALSIDRATGEALDVSGEVAIATVGAGASLRKVRLEAREIPAELLAALAGGVLEAAQASGAMRLSADLSAPSTGAGLSGTLSLAAPRLEVQGFVLEDVEARGSLDAGSKVILDQASLATLGGTVAGTGSWPGRLDVTLAAIDLSALQGRMGGPAMTGNVAGRGSLMGGGSEPTRVQGSVTGHDVIIGGMEVGDVAGTLEGSPSKIQFDLHDEAKALHATGEIVKIPDGSPAIEARLEARPFSLNRLRPILPPEALAGLRGDADADVTISGTLTSLRDLTVKARVDRVSIAAGEFTLTNDGPLFLTMMDGFLTLTNGRMVGDQTNLELGGSMNLAGDREATLRVAGTFDLGVLEILSPEMRAFGPATVDIRIVERADGTTYSGEVAIQGASLRHPSLPQPVERLRAVAAFEEGGVLRIQQLTFDTGGGHVTGEGWARFEGAAADEAHLELRGRGIQAELLPSMRAFFDADITIDKEGPDYRAAGQVNILRAIYARAFGLEPSALLLRSREFGPARERMGEAPTVYLHIRIDAEKDLWVRNDDALIEASANLRLEGTLAHPELNGRITAMEGGTLRFRDVTYRIEGGSIEFTDLTRIDPELNILASTRVQEYDIHLKVTGRFSRPLYDLTSEPPLPQSDIVWLLVTGRTLSESGNQALQGAAETQVAGYLAAPVAGAVTAPLGRLLGVSSLQIDPTLLHGTADPTARLTVTKRVAQDILFTYSSQLGQSGQEVYQINYNPGRIWDMIATRDYDSSIGADMRIRRRWRAWGWGGETVSPVPAGQEPLGKMRVGTVRVVADTLIKSEASLMRRIPVGEGDPLIRGDLLEGRENIRVYYVEHGYPAAQVDVVESEPRPGPPILVDVTYTVQAGPRYELAIEGDVRERRLRKAVREAWKEPVLLEDLVEEARTAVLRALQGRGRYLAEVEARMETPAPQERLVTLEAEPGPRVHVRSVAIEGNAHMPDDRIRRQMLTKPGGFLKLFGQGRLKEKVMEDDLAAIRALYQASGFLEARVNPPQVKIVDDGKGAEITVTVEEGPRYLIGSVAIEGEVPGVEGAEMLEEVGLPPGSNLTDKGLGDGADRLRALLDRHGFPQARVTARIEGQPEKMRVIYAVSAGQRERIAKVTFTGNRRTNDRTIHREITLDSGDYLTRKGTLESQRNLFRLGVFRSVEVQTTPVPGQPGKVDVNFHLVEGPPILTAWGVGYDSNDGPRGSFELADNNLFGSRRSASIFLRYSPVNRRAQLTLRDPNLFGEKIDTLVSSYLEVEETDSYDASRLGVVGQLSRPLTVHTTVFGRYRLEDVDLSNVDLSPDELTPSEVRLGSVGASITHDIRNDILNPTAGGLSSFDVRFYGPVWGSEEQFMKIFAYATAFKDIGHEVVWASSVRAGLITSRDIPLSERFFAGGDTTLRGFDYNTVGPKDPETGEPLGGQGVFIFNQELRFPIHKAFTGVVFFDAGNVYADVSDYDITDLRYVLGFGLRLATPVGPFRVEFGRKLDREPDESRGEIFFSIGQAF